LERTRGGSIKNHPLKRLNDDEFKPIFDEIISTVSRGRMTASASLNIGGNWFIIPNILALDEEREPWEQTHTKGRLALQIHYSDDFKKVYLSAVIQYNQKSTESAERIPDQVKQRCMKLSQHLENYSSSAILDLPQFHHWTYKEDYLWGKPLLSFVYEVDSLPSDRTLLKNLEDLATAVNAMTMI
tara:strand:- start:168 stop:722 length:555 start_codon:yes stop_codon:yes gene_type:complete